MAAASEIPERLKFLKRPFAAARSLIAGRKRSIHFLHIGKAAGTQIQGVAKQINERSSSLRIKCHNHDTALRGLPAGEAYFFSIRNPETRFVSGFYSRKRKGQPLLFAEWSRDEAAAFAAFEHANELAECLFETGSTGAKALMAATSISHCAMHQIDWFRRMGFFFELRPPLAILRQENFAVDLAAFLERLEIDFPVHIERDKVQSHANDYRGIPALSEKARHNLRLWYSRDYAFYDQCERWIGEQGMA